MKFQQGILYPSRDLTHCCSLAGMQGEVQTHTCKPVSSLPNTTINMEATIIGSYTVAEFKELLGINKLNVIRNPKTGLLFTEVSNLTVSHRADLAEPLQIIEFDNGHYVLCNAGDNNVVLSL
jgi:hypothetical protein